MKGKNYGFIGGGRITKIILGGFKKADKMPSKVVVSDISNDILNKLKGFFPEINITTDNTQSASQDAVFIALHPPVISGLLGEIKSHLKPNATVFSFAPKFTIAKLSEGLAFHRIARMIPNANSIIDRGYNPICFSKAFSEDEKKEILDMFSILGDCPEVTEEKLEAYAILTAMGPTYLWFQLFELQKIVESFGLTPQEASEGIVKMVIGSVEAMYESGLSPNEVMDLVPVKPIGDEEEGIKNIYRSKLEALFNKIKA